MPDADLARRALKACLESWVAEETNPQLDSETRKLQFADSLRVGRKLARFEIISELPMEVGRRFEVELTLSEPKGNETTQYVVLGIDPLWVIRQEDYDMITHWDHPMPAPEEPVIAPKNGKLNAGATK